MPINSIAILVVACTPDALLCRPIYNEIKNYDNLQACHQELSDALSDAPTGQVYKGACIELGEQAEMVMQWGIGPTSSLITSFNQWNAEAEQIQVSMSN